MATTYKVLDVVGSRYTVKYTMGANDAIIEADYDGAMPLERWLSVLSPFNRPTPPPSSQVDHSANIGKTGAVQSTALPEPLNPPPEV